MFSSYSIKRRIPAGWAELRWALCRGDVIIAHSQYVWMIIAMKLRLTA